jgi:hypothetical protein
VDGPLDEAIPHLEKAPEADLNLIELHYNLERWRLAGVTPTRFRISKTQRRAWKSWGTRFHIRADRVAAVAPRIVRGALSSAVQRNDPKLIRMIRSSIALSRTHWALPQTCAHPRPGP